MNVVRWWKVGIMIALSVLLWTGLVGLAVAKSTETLTGIEHENRLQTQTAEAPLCRFGANVTDGHFITEFTSSLLRIGWYNDYRTLQTPARPEQIHYMPTINIRQTGPLSYSQGVTFARIDSFIAANPGAEWIIGNEPDRRKFQDSSEPQVYALAYHNLYHYIKGKDPTARLIAGSIVQPTPVRLQYLDKVLESYQSQFSTTMPVDIWAIHNFILNEASCDHYNNNLEICWGADIPPGITATDGLRVTIHDNDSMPIFTEQIIRFRHWMADNGYREVPLYLSEYGILMPPAYGYLAPRVNRFMNRSFDYLLNTTDPEIGYPADNNRLVQRLSWYSFNDKARYNGYLFEQATISASFQLSPMGQNYITYTSAISDSVDLYPVNFKITPIPNNTGGDPLTYTLSAQIANSGNTLAAHNALVRFRLIAANGQESPIGTDQSIRLAGCGQHTTVQMEWSPPANSAFPLLNYLFAVTVEPTNAGSEVDASNNRKLLAPNHNYLPIITSR